MNLAAFDNIQIPEINFTEQFKKGMPTNLMSTFGKAMGMVENVQSLGEDIISTGRNAVSYVTRAGSEFAGQVSGEVLGSIMGVGMTAEQTLQAVKDIGLLFADDMAQYAAYTGAYLLDYASNWVVSFPVDVASYAAEYSAARIQDELGSIAKQIVTPMDSMFSDNVTADLQEQLGQVTDALQNTVGNVTGKLHEYIEYGTDAISGISSYLCKGKDWVAGKVQDIEDGITGSLDKLISEKTEELDKFKERQVQELGKKAGDAIADAAIRVSKKPLMKAAQEAEVLKQKVMNTAATLVRTAIMTVLSIVGV